VSADESSAENTPRSLGPSLFLSNRAWALELAPVREYGKDVALKMGLEAWMRNPSGVTGVGRLRAKLERLRIQANN
jgi:hypothetical protein